MASSSTSTAGSASAARSERHQLALARRQLRAALAHLGVEPRRAARRSARSRPSRAQRLRPRRRSRRAGRCATLSRIGALEQEALLGHHHDALRAARPAWRRAGRRRRSARRPRSGRRSAPSTWPASTCPRRSGRRARVARRARPPASTSLQHGVVGAGVGERHRRAPRPRRSTAGRRRRVARAIAGFSSRSTNSLCSAAPGRLQGVEQLAELLHGLEQVLQVEHERGDRADRHRAGRREAAAQTRGSPRRPRPGPARSPGSRGRRCARCAGGP